MFQVSSIDLAWKNSDLNTLLPIILSLILFIVYWYTVQSDFIKKNFYSKYNFDKASVKYFFFTKYFGLLTLGVLPALVCLISIPVYSLKNYGLTINPDNLLFSFYWICGLSALVIPLIYFHAKKPENLNQYPQLRIKEWNNKIIFIYIFGWTLYLLGYEFLFRGVLLFPLAHNLGVWPAIAINVSLYSATHIPKGASEAIGAIPLGLVFCILTLISGSIWIAYFVHLVIAITNSAVAFKFNPDMQYSNS